MVDEVETSFDEVETSLSLYIGLEYKPTFDNKLHNLKQNDTIIVSAGEVASIFCRNTYLTKTYEKVASIVCKIRERHKSVAEIFYDGSSRTLVVICDVKCDETAIPVALSVCAFFFLQHLMENKHCVIMTSQHITYYEESTEYLEDDEPFLKTYATSKYMNKYPTLVIDHPYIPDVFGLNGEDVMPGDVLLDLCERIGMTAILYVCYTRYTDSNAVRKLEGVRNDPLLSQIQTKMDEDYVNVCEKSLKLWYPTSSFV